MLLCVICSAHPRMTHKHIYMSSAHTLMTQAYAPTDLHADLLAVQTRSFAREILSCFRGSSWWGCTLLCEARCM